MHHTFLYASVLLLQTIISLISKTKKVEEWQSLDKVKTTQYHFGISSAIFPKDIGFECSHKECLQKSPRNCYKIGKGKCLLFKNCFILKKSTLLGILY